MKIEEINLRDPYILPFDGKYYMYGSRGFEATGFDVYVSDDLKNWIGPKSVFEIYDSFWADRDCWAPEVHLYKGKFYMLASFKSEKVNRGTQILVSDSPDGNFMPLTDRPSTPEEWTCLDGTLYIDNFGKPHMVFCHEWAEIGDGTICEIKLSEDLKTVLSKPRILWKASDCKEVVDYLDNRISKITDGPFMYRLNNGELICIWSSFNRNGYMEIVARSDNGDIDGNWKIDEIPLSACQGGHGMIFKTFDNKTMFVMHCPNEISKERPVMYEVCENDGKISLR